MTEEPKGLSGITIREGKLSKSNAHFYEFNFFMKITVTDEGIAEAQYQDPSFKKEIVVQRILRHINTELRKML
jgi:hypothetical protein